MFDLSSKIDFSVVANRFFFFLSPLMLYLQVSACIMREIDMSQVFFHKILHDYSSRRAGTIRAAQKIHRPPLDCGMVDEVGDYQAPATLVDHY